MSAQEQTAPTLVLLEGPSDVAAITAVLGDSLAGAGHASYALVDMGGVTNVGAHLRRAAEHRPAPRMIGLCDAGEAGVVVRALQRLGRDVEEPADLAAEHFFVCERDLEDELIRALGPDTCLGLLEEVGLAPRFASFSRQPAWQGRPLVQRLHRFCGIASGRKVMLAGVMAAALGPGQLPAPLAGLVGSLRRSMALD